MKGKRIFFFMKSKKIFSFEEHMAKILVIDDEEAVREVLTDFLVSEGYLVECAENGKRALQLIEKTDFDLIVMDVFMPEFDGIELIQELNMGGSHPPIITISGGGGILPPNWSVKLTEVYGVASTLTKPIDLEFFLDAVRNTLEPKKQVGGAA